MNIKKINLKKFVRKGYLQEVNRCFFHPVGLALGMKVEDDEYQLDAIYDLRDSETPFHFGYDRMTEEELSSRIEKKNFIDQEMAVRNASRTHLLGDSIEPLGEDKYSNWKREQYLYTALQMIANGDPVSVGLDEITDLAQKALDKYDDYEVDQNDSQ
jgi:hypothetical protein